MIFKLVKMNVLWSAALQIHFASIILVRMSVVSVSRVIMEIRQSDASSTVMIAIKMQHALSTSD